MSATPRTLRSPLVLIAALVVAGGVLTACGGSDNSGTAAGSSSSSKSGSASAGGSGSTGGDGQVKIVNFEFKPQDITVKAGTTVTWTNTDSAQHSIQDQSDLKFDTSKVLMEGDTFTHTYDKPGTYPYICGIHNYMTGKVVVEG